jgi:hypothetical protein
LTTLQIGVKDKDEKRNGWICVCSICSCDFHHSEQTAALTDLSQY